MKSYLKFLSRNKLYTAIELVGLAASLAFVILIGCYAWEQYAITRQHPDRERIYVLGMPDYYGLTWGFRQSAEERIPEIEQIVSITVDLELVFRIGDELVPTQTVSVDPEFFDLFPYCRILTGSADALRSQTGALVSERFARAHDLQPGAELHFGDDVYTVGGIVADFDRSLFRYADVFVAQNAAVNQTQKVPYDQYGSVVPFVKLRADADYDAFFAKVEALCREIYPSYGGTFFEYLRAIRLDRIFFDPANNGYHFNRGDWPTLRLLILVGLLLLVSAIFNYINLNTALSGRRAKEMAMRRLLGASRGEIIGKYIAESVCFTAVSFGAALLLAYAFAPVVNTLLNRPDIAVEVHLTPGIGVVFAAMILGVGLLSGAVPASLAARFKPVDVVKGTYRRRTKMTFSKVFIVLQNALALFLLAMAFVMELQYAKSLDRPMHADITDKFLIGPLNGRERQALVDRVRTLPCVQRLGCAQGAPGYLPGGQYSKTRTGEDILYRTYKMDSAAFAMLQFERLRDFGAPLANSIWFSERSFAATGFDDDYHDISQTLALRMRGCGEVAGTYADFPQNTDNLGEEEYALVQVLSDEVMQQMYFYHLLIETTGDRAAARQALTEAYEKWTREAVGLTVEPRVASYLEELFAEGMRPARNNMRLLELFMLLAIFLSMLGLVAMSTYYAGQQAKSIAVRKVFGGTVGSETWQSVRGYMVQTGAAALLGLPFAVWAAGRYLEAYIYRIEHYGWLIAASVLLTGGFAFASIFWQTLRAARTNPATELKKE